MKNWVFILAILLCTTLVAGSGFWLYRIAYQHGKYDMATVWIKGCVVGVTIPITKDLIVRCAEVKKPSHKSPELTK